MKVFAIFSVLLATEPTQVEADAAGGTSDVSAPQPWDQRVLHGEQLYSQERYLEAADVFEGLWQEFHQPRHLFNAGLARFGSGHYAHAIEWLEAFLKLPDTPATLRTTAHEQIEQAAREIGAISIGVTSSQARGPVAVEFEYTGPTDSARPKLSRMLDVGHGETLGTVQQQIRLDPGVWRVKTRANGYESTEVTVEVLEGSSVQPVVLELRPVSDTEPKSRPILGYSFLGSGAALALGGGITLGVGSSRQTPMLASGINFRSGGATVFALGLGVISAGSVAFAKNTRSRRIAWMTTAGVGSGILIGGALLTYLGASRGDALIKEYDSPQGSYDAQQDYYEAQVKNLKRYETQQTVGGAILGFGIGVLASSTIGLIHTYVTDRRPTKAVARKTSIRIHPVLFGNAGAVLSGQF